MPLATLAAALCGVYGAAALGWLARQPLLQGLGPLAPTLAHLSSTQPWSTLVCVVASLLSAYYAFLVMPTLDWVLGSDVSNPPEVRGCVWGWAGGWWW